MKGEPTCVPENYSIFVGTRIHVIEDKSQLAHLQMLQVANIMSSVKKGTANVEGKWVQHISIFCVS